MRASSDRPTRIGVVPVLDGSGGGIYQYSATMLDGLLSIVPRPELILFADRRLLPKAEVWRARGYQVAPLWPRTLRSRLRAGVHKAIQFTPIGRTAVRFLRAATGRRTGPAPMGQVAMQPALARWIASFGVDFLVFPAPSLTGAQSGVPYLMAVHDLQHRIHPEFPEVSADGEWESREHLFGNGISHALTVLVDSEVGREDVLDFYGEAIVADSVQILPFLPAVYLEANAAGPPPTPIREIFSLPEHFLFFPAQFWPHKNHVRVVRALARIRAQDNVDVHVVMCGSAADPLRASVLDEIQRTAAEEGVTDLIHLLGYVEDGLMAPLYSASRGVLLPTFFGPTNIPVLEGWTFGVPVLTSDLRGIREQCGDAAILVDPSSVGAIADGIFALWSDEPLRERLIALGSSRLALYGREQYIGRLSSIVADAARRTRGVELPTR
ncbi:MAG TPA: glycosyltransferase family 1 protein [Candidatus Limnocylindrales bacterium]